MSYPIAYTAEEGGRWLALPERYDAPPSALLFDDGLVYDFKLAEFGVGINPWRKYSGKQKIRIKAGRVLLLDSLA